MWSGVQMKPEASSRKNVPPDPNKKRVAVIGSGVSGIGATWALHTSTGHEVHLFEADEVLGGHTNTVPWRHNGQETQVDTGFIVYNLATYPNFISFLKHLQALTAPTAMTFGVSRDNGVFEWAGTSLGSIFAQWSNLASPRFWRLLYDVIRFNVYALDLLRNADESEEDPASGDVPHHASGSRTNAKHGTGAKSKHDTHQSIGDYCDQHSYSQAFKDDYLIPMTAAVWSTPPHQCTLQFPALTLVRFMYNHHLLSTFAHRPSWMTIPGGSAQYIKAALKDFPDDRVHLRTPIIGIEEINNKLILQFDNDEEDLFDHVILAVHGDTAANIIHDGGTEEERSILSHFHTTENVAYLHNDTTLLPRRRAVWSSWNLLTSTSRTGSASTDDAKVALTYNMNILQHIPISYSDVLVTLNPPTPPHSKTIQGKYIYHHPLYTPETVQAQKQLPTIQNKRGISYAGAWTKYGFHEDGFASGIAVAVEHLGATLPFNFVDATFMRGRRPKLSVGDWVLRFCVYWIGWLVAGAEGVWYAIEPGWWVLRFGLKSVQQAVGWVVGLGRKKSKKESADEGVKSE
ncbi:MAG: hypothetical protein Q9162_000956 [Coniocarpon cinnabarinum]